MFRNLSNLSNLFDGPCSSCDKDETNPQHGMNVENHKMSETAVIVLSIVCAFGSVFGTLGNFLVLFTVFKTRTLRTVPDLFISSLAFSDLAVCSVYMPLLIYGYNLQSTNNRASLENEPYKTVSAFLGHCSIVASVTNILTVTVDRVIATRLPLKYLAIMTFKTAVYFITAVWVISLAWGVLYARASIPYFYIRYYFVFLLVSTLIMYIYIFISAKHQENKLEVNQPSFDRSAARQKIERKATKTIFVVVGLYVLCLLPFLIFTSAFKNAYQFKKAFPWVLTILACNSSLNPYVYCVRSQKYRSQFAKILRIGRFCDGRLNSTSMPP